MRKLTVWLLLALVALGCSSTGESQDSGPMSQVQELGVSKQPVEFDYRLGMSWTTWNGVACDTYGDDTCLVPRGVDTVRLWFSGNMGGYLTHSQAAVGWVSDQLATISQYGSQPSIPSNGIRIKVRAASLGVPSSSFTDVTFEPYRYVHVACLSAQYAGVVDGYGAEVYKCSDYVVDVDTGAIHSWASNNPNAVATTTPNTVFTAVAWGIAHAQGVPTRQIHPSYANCTANLVYGPDVGACSFTSGQKCTVDSLYPNVGLYVHDNCG